MNILLTIFGGAVGAAIIGFIEFLIRRSDDKKDKNSEVLKAIKELSKRVDELGQKGDERDAVSSRVRILRFADEMMKDMRHSKDSWDQCLSDITEYEEYCSTHPRFKNNQTVATVEYINKNYAERLEKHDFL